MEWENAYRQAVLDELTANEGLTDKDNGLDFSILGIKEKTSPSALVPLMQQCLLLAGKENVTYDDEFVLEETLTSIFALIDSEERKREVMPGKVLQDIGSIFRLDELEREVKKLDDIYAAILNPKPKPSPNAHPSSNRYNYNHGVEKTKLDKENESRTNQPPSKTGDFLTAGQMLGRPPPAPKPPTGSGVIRKPVGLSKRVKTEAPKPVSYNDEDSSTSTSTKEAVDPRLKGIDPKLLETIENEIIHRVDTVTWEQIAGLEHAKNTIKEIVIWPMLRPDIFKGLRGPPKGLLLFGPPGTGKTMIGKCIASQAKATFFSISASSLTSKWVGEGEKLVRALFACARVFQPSVIFIDEIDSLLTQRTDGEFEASRRIKTEFLVQFDGASTSSDDRILVIGATNRPQELDEAARRRLVKRLYIPLPEGLARKTIVTTLLSSQQHSLTEEDIAEICQRTEGYSGADMDNLCREAALGPIRCIENILDISPDQVRPITMSDFLAAMNQVRASVSSNDLDLYLDWNSKFGSLAAVK